MVHQHHHPPPSPPPSLQDAGDELNLAEHEVGKAKMLCSAGDVEGHRCKVHTHTCTYTPHIYPVHLHETFTRHTFIQTLLYPCPAPLPTRAAQDGGYALLDLGRAGVPEDPSVLSHLGLPGRAVFRCLHRFELLRDTRGAQDGLGPFSSDAFTLWGSGPAAKEHNKAANALSRELLRRSVPHHLPLCKHSSLSLLLSRFLSFYRATGGRETTRQQGIEIKRQRDSHRREGMSACLYKLCL